MVVLCAVNINLNKMRKFNLCYSGESKLLLWNQIFCCFKQNWLTTYHFRLKYVQFEVNYFSSIRKPFCQSIHLRSRTWPHLGHWISVWNRHQACYRTKTCKWSCVTWRKRKVNNVFVARITFIEEANLFSPCVCLQDCNLRLSVRRV